MVSFSSADLGFFARFHHDYSTHLSPDGIRAADYSSLCHRVVFYQGAFHLKWTNAIPEKVDLKEEISIARAQALP